MKILIIFCIALLMINKAFANDPYKMYDSHADWTVQYNSFTGAASTVNPDGSSASIICPYDINQRCSVRIDLIGDCPQGGQQWMSLYVDNRFFDDAPFTCIGRIIGQPSLTGLVSDFDSNLINQLAVGRSARFVGTDRDKLPITLDISLIGSTRMMTSLSTLLNKVREVPRTTPRGQNVRTLPARGQNI